MTDLPCDVGFLMLLRWLRLNAAPASTSSLLNSLLTILESRLLYDNNHPQQSGRGPAERAAGAHVHQSQDDVPAGCCAARSLPAGQAGHAQLQRLGPRAPGSAAAYQPLPCPLQPAGFSAALVPCAQVRPSWNRNLPPPLPARGASCCSDFLDGFRPPMLPPTHSKKRKSFTSHALGA